MSTVPDNLVQEPDDSDEPLASFMVMAESKEEIVVNEPQKWQTLEDNVREVDRNLSNFMNEMYDAEHQTKALPY